MSTLTVNIEDKGLENAVKSYLESLGLNYSIDAPEWWQDKSFVKELDKRSSTLKNGVDNGISFADIKKNLLKP